jgi:hypothetical protein
MIFGTMKQLWLVLAPQRRLISYGAVTLGALLLVACGGPETAATPTPTPTVMALPQIDPTPPTVDAYPAPIQPVQPAEPADGYPAAPASPALPSGYPGDATWFILPAGSQCEEPLYADLQAAVAALQGAGISVITAETVTLPVCQGCGCPTSEHYRVEIPAGAANAAMALEWMPE